MTPITDPNLIAQLEGSGGAPASGYGAPVTDPALISQLEGTGQQAQGNPSLLLRDGADALAGIAQMGHGLINTPHNVVSYFDPQMGAKIPFQQDYNFSSMLGVNNPNLGDKLIQGAAQYLPYMAVPGGMLAQGLAFGATQSKNPITGALIAGLFGKAGELAPAAIGAVGSGINRLTGTVQPQKFAEQMMQNLGGGNSLEGNAQSLAQDIKGAYSNRVNQGQALYKPVFEGAGDNSIYEGVNQASVRQPVSNFNNILDFFNSAQKEVNNGAYNQLDDSVINSYDRNLNKLHEQFTNNPTLQNAHDLQSQLGYASRQLQAKDMKSGLDPANRSILQGYQEAQGALKGDINSFLTNKNPVLADQYNSATANWAQNVTPYLESPKLSQIAKGEITNPTAIANLFKNPEPEMQQIVNDIGSSANNKILYSELGKTQANLTPEKLTSAFNQLDNKGLSSYITPDLSHQFEQLVNKTTARNTAQTAATGVLGAHFFGPIGAVAGAMGPTLLRRVGQLTPSLNLPLGNALMNVGRAAYRPTVNTGTANLINWQGGQ